MTLGTFLFFAFKVEASIPCFLSFFFLPLCLSLFLAVCLYLTFLSFYCTPAVTTAFPNCDEFSNKRNTVEENNIQPISFMNNWGWEQRLNVPKSLQKGKLGTVGSSKWRCWHIKNVSAQKSCNMVSVNCKQHSDVYLAQLVCEASYQSNERVRRSEVDISIGSAWITLQCWLVHFCCLLYKKVTATIKNFVCCKIMSQSVIDLSFPEKNNGIDYLFEHLNKHCTFWQVLPWEKWLLSLTH